MAEEKNYKLSKSCALNCILCYQICFMQIGSGFFLVYFFAAFLSRERIRPKKPSHYRYSPTGERNTNSNC